MFWFKQIADRFEFRADPAKSARVWDYGLLLIKAMELIRAGDTKLIAYADI